MAATIMATKMESHMVFLLLSLCLTGVLLMSGDKLEISEEDQGTSPSSGSRINPLRLTGTYRILAVGDNTSARASATGIQSHNG
jgi:hypothetical protein